MEKAEMMEKKMELEEELPVPVPDDQVRNWDGDMLYQYHGFWLISLAATGFIPFRTHFQALDSDVLLATFPKSGTTWLKALAFSIINRTHYKDDTNPHPLLSSTPHSLVPFIEVLYRNNLNPVLDHPHHHGSRMFATHLPPTLLAPSISSTKCRIIYICRHPLDQFVSYYMFHLKIRNLESQHDDELLDEAFDLFCRGIQLAGPLWSHALEYWKMSRDRPDKVLFLKYEDVKEDTAGHVKRVAEFLGCPLSPEEEREGVIGDIVDLCSFESLKAIPDVNKTNESVLGFENSAFFRKGEVGDWANYLTPAMAKRAQKIVEQNLAGSGLTFNFNKTYN